MNSTPGQYKIFHIHQTYIVTIVTEYMYTNHHVCRSHNQVLSSFMTYHRVCANGCHMWSRNFLPFCTIWLYPRF